MPSDSSSARLPVAILARKRVCSPGYQPTGFKPQSGCVRTGNLWERVLKTGREIAWDIYLLYGADAQWTDQPPPPDYWMHQLTVVTAAPRLDDETFAKQLQAMRDRQTANDAKKSQP